MLDILLRPLLRALSRGLCGEGREAGMGKQSLLAQSMLLSHHMGWGVLVAVCVKDWFALVLRKHITAQIPLVHQQGSTPVDG